ncbi:translation initiation factor IF-2 [Candidatus Margulisiibacteriota bacterium]
MKVKELADELGLEATELKDMLKEMGMQVKTVASKLEDDTVATIREVVKEVKEEVTKAPEKKPESRPIRPPVRRPAPAANVPPRKGVPVQVVEKPDSRKRVKKEKEVVEEVEEVWEEQDDALLPPPTAGEIIHEAEIKELTLNSDTISLRALAEKMKVSASDVIKELIKEGILMTINQEVDVDVAKKIGEIFKVTILSPTKKEDISGDLEKVIFKEEAAEDNPKLIKRRSPVVTIMGHVDHGKTKLLDSIRNANVIATEAGGITQHIGAYQVNVHGKKVTFLDTPGHAAFTALRARGAQVTDIVILIIAADDGIMPQTIEAIDHAKAAKVPIVVAINKIDKPDADIEKVKQQLTEYHLVPEEWGGDTVVVPISAKEGKGIKELLEMLLLVAELKELKANPSVQAKGVIIEARLSRKRGAVATVLVQSGTLHKSNSFVIGTTYGKVRAMFNDQGKEVNKATPSMPVEVLGFNEVPQSGEILQVVAEERTARLISEERKVIQGGGAPKARGQISLENFSKEVKEGKKKELNLVIKADVQGSLEAVSGALQKIKVKNVQVNILHAATGVVNESDILLAKASNAIIIGFTVTITTETQKLAEAEGVDVRLYNIIYKAIEDIELAMEGILEPEFEEVPLGTLEVRQIFKSSKEGQIAGCFVTEGRVVRNATAKVMRKKEFIYEGKIDSLKRFKDDAKEVQKGYECGISFKAHNDIRVGDLIKVFEMKEKPRERARSKKASTTT